jgi:hypothetical protein
MYCRLLEDAVHDLKNEKVPDPPSKTSVEIGVAGVIPKPYIPSDQRRLEAYRRLAIAASEADLTQVEVDLKEGIWRATPLTIRERDVIFRTPTPKELAARLLGIQGTVTPLAPKSTDSLAEVYYRPPPAYMEPETLLAVLRKRLCDDVEVKASAGADAKPSTGAAMKAPVKVKGFASVTKPKGPARKPPG